jgi:hypothetical protein
MNSIRIAAASAGVVVAIVTVSHGALAPAVKEPGWEQGSVVLERWMKVQGLDRPVAEVFPRECVYELTTGNPAATTRFRLLDAREAGYYLATETPNHTLRAEIARYANVRWMLDEDVGIGQLPGVNPFVSAMRETRFEPAVLKQRFSSWSRPVDAEWNGLKCQVVRMRANAGNFEFWWFDAGTGSLVLATPMPRPVGAEPEGTVFRDFRLVDGALEPFEMVFTTGGQRSVFRALKTKNRVELEPRIFDAPPAQFKAWQQSEAILLKYIKAMGGVAKLAQIVSRVTHIKAKAPMNGTEFEMTISQKLPNRVAVETNVPGIGRTWQGYDGKSGWVSSELKGFRTLRGPELQAMIQTSDLHNAEHFNEVYPLRKIQGVKEVQGRRTAAIDLANLAGKAGTHYFDLGTGQLVRVETVMGGGGVAIPVTMDFSDFRTVDGVVIPFATTMANPAMRLEMTVTSVEHNVEIPDAVFQPRKEE